MHHEQPGSIAVFFKVRGGTFNIAEHHHEGAAKLFQFLQTRGVGLSQFE